MMPLGVLKNGVITPVEPLPAEWTEGKKLWIEEAFGEEETQDVEDWYRELSARCAARNPEDDAILRAAIDEHCREAKELMKKRMGLQGVHRIS